MNADETLLGLEVGAPLIIEHSEYMERGTLVRYTPTQKRIIVKSEHGKEYSFAASGFLIGENWAKTFLRLPNPADSEHFERGALRQAIRKAWENNKKMSTAQLRALAFVCQDFAGYEAKEQRFLELETLVGMQVEQINELEAIVAEQDDKLENEIPYDFGF